MDDWQLLNEYSTRNSDEAFRALADRHAGMVYHAALRQVGDPHLAEDIVQAVFIALSHKAAGISKNVVLSGWLLRATRFAVLNLSRRETRRRRHEQEASEMNTPSDSHDTDSIWSQLSPHLDDALHRLSQSDRDAVAIRFFENKSHKEVGQVLGVSEAAAKRRVARAVEKLRVIFARRGMVVPAAVLVAAFSTYGAQAAPVNLVSQVTTAVALKTAAASPTLTLAKGTLKLMAWTKLKTTLVVAAGLLLAAGATTTLTIREIRGRPDYWQIQNFTVATLERARPQVSILPSKFNHEMGWISYELDGKLMGTGDLVEDLIAAAYGFPKAGFKTRAVMEATLPAARYDFISNLDSGASNALQRAICENFGLAIRREARETNVLILSALTPNAARLKPAALTAKQTGGGSYRTGHFSATGLTMQNLADALESHLGVPVIDGTGRSGRFAFDVKWDEPDTKHPNPAALQQAITDQLGLQLTPEIQPIEMLVIGKTK